MLHSMSSSYDKVKAWRAKHEPEALRAIRREEARRARAKDPEGFKAKHSEYRARYRAKHRERLLPLEAEKARERRKQDPFGNARRSLAFKARLLAKREAECGRKRPMHCELCKEKPNGRGFTVWDHCHKTQRFRGWLCDRCNKVLGLVKDSRELLFAMAAYLEKHQPPQTTE